MTEHDLIVKSFTDLIFIVNKMFLITAKRLWIFQEPKTLLLQTKEVALAPERMYRK